MTKIFIIAGESSGDRLGGRLIAAINKKDPNAMICGIGGDKMIAAGMMEALPIKKVGIIGIAEIIPKLFYIIKSLFQTVRCIREFRPDILVTIDCPGFSFRVASRVMCLKGMKRVHYVSPTVWAYKPERVKTVARLYDLLLAIFPFETKYYKGTGVDCKYIGHPLTEEDWVVGAKKSAKDIGVMVGSRMQEIKTLLPIFVEALNIFCRDSKSKDQVVFPVNSTAAMEYIQGYSENMKFKFRVLDTRTLSEEERARLFRSFKFAIVKSGTVSLELVFARVPMIVAYKINFISYLMARYVFKIQNNIKYVSIANLLLNRGVIPEYLQHDCTPEKLANGLIKLTEATFRVTQQNAYEEVVKMLSNKNHTSPSDLAAKYILGLKKTSAKY